MLRIENQKRDPMVPPLSVSALFSLSCLMHLDDVVVEQDELLYTRRQMVDDCSTVARALLQLGIKTGDVITVASSRPVYESIVVFLAANRIGASVAFFDEVTPQDLLVFYLQQFRSPLVVCYSDSTVDSEYLVSEVGTLKNALLFDGSSCIDKAQVGGILLKTLSDKYRGPVPTNVFSKDKTALITFTSGSTSGPKPLRFTNNALVSGAIFNKSASGVRMWDKDTHSWMQCVKFNYPYGFWVSTMSPILGGGKVVLTPRLAPETINYYLKKKPDTIFGVPQLIDIIEERISPEIRLDNLKMYASGGDYLSPEAAERAISLFRAHGADVTICNGYGLAEVLGLVSTSVGQSYHPGTVGRVPAGVHVMVIDEESGEELGFDQPGVICVNGKHMLSEYYRRLDLNQERFFVSDGMRFLITGDCGTVDQDGFVRLVGRSTFFINNVPAKVYNEYVRTAIMSCPLVADCRVVKCPDDVFGFAPAAFVITNNAPGDDTTRHAILEKTAEPFFVGRDCIVLSEYERPRRIIFLDAFPLNEAGKADILLLERIAMSQA